MPITVTCDECSESHRVKDDALGKRFKCKGCGKSLKVEAAAPPEDDFGNFDDADLDDDADNETTGESLPVRRRARTVSGSANKKSRKKSSGRTSGSQRPLIIGVVIAVVALIGGGTAYASLQLPRQQFNVLLSVFGAIGAVAYFVMYDRFCRYRIRRDVESYDGTVQSISWRPFQGAFFTRGWGQGKHAKFYEVSYTDRDGRTQHSLVCCRWFGTNWDV